MRNYLKEGTWIRLPGGECYKIIGTPICEGGGSLIYPVVKQIYTADGNYRSSELKYALKECFPISSEHSFIRNPSGEIIPEVISNQSCSYLHTVQNMQLTEQEITSKIYNTGFRLVPILSGSTGVEISSDHGTTFTFINNTVTIMESLTDKGHSLRSYLTEQKRVSPVLAFRIIEQLLLAVREVHRAGFLHLDIQDGNIFIKGQLSDSSDFASLIDFGSARKLSADGLCAAIENRVIFSTEGFSAPEITYKNDGSLRLGPEADIYSIGYLLLLLLTGQRYHPYELYSNSDGHYLTRFKLRKINCPKHLTERMQNILAKALENEPEMRYHSCDEMLEDVSEFAKALQPYRSDLSQVAYDAFICYKHGEIDSSAAKALQKHLEHFQPFQKKGQKMIRRVFVDEGELSACSDFGLQIREALKNAGWLIVICSPETKNSPWVELEINTFLEFHDRSRILAVMTDGEPKDIFPDVLLGDSKSATEVLAADARGQDLHTVLKKLKKDALLRIAAPILGTTYDSLKQRHRSYVMSRFAIAASIVTIFLAVFTAYTLRQAAEINEQYQQARRNQARYLSSISSELLNSGDRNRALLTALAVEPEKDSDGAVVPEQMYALNNALTSYKSGFKLRYDPAYTGDVSDASYGVLSPEGTFYYALDQQGDLVVLSGETGELLWTVTPSDIKKTIKDLYLYHDYEDFRKIRIVLPVSENQVLVGLQYCMAVIDVEAHEIIRTFPLESSTIMDSEVYDLSEEIFAYANAQGELMVYNINTGEQIDHLNLNDSDADSMVEYDIEAVSISKDHTTIAIGLSYAYSQDDYYSWSATADERAAYRQTSDEYFSQNPPNGLILYELATQTVTPVSTTPTSQVLYADETHLAVLHFSNPISGADFQDNWGNENYSYYQALYEMPSAKQLFRSETSIVLRTSTAGFLAEELEIDQTLVPVLIAWFRGKLTVLNLNSGETLAEITYQSNIIGVSTYGKHRIFICLNDGDVQMLYLDYRIGRNKVLSLTAQVTQYTYNEKTDELILIGDGRVLFCGNNADTDMKLFDSSNFSSEEMVIGNVCYTETGGNSYRYLCLSQENSSDICEILVFPVHSTDCIYHYVSPDSGNSISNIGFGYEQGNFYISFVEKSSDYSQISFTKANITTGETEISEDITRYDTLEFTSNVIYNSKMNALFVPRRSGGVIRFDISGDTLIPGKKTILTNVDNIENISMAGDEKYLVVSAQSSDYRNLNIYLYNMESETSAKLNFEEDFTIDSLLGAVVTGNTSPYICVYDGNKTIHIVDCETESILSTVYTDGSNICQISFFNRDTNLIVAAENVFYLYDIPDGKVLHKYTSSVSSSFWNIITDSSTNYFALKDSSTSENLLFETGISHKPLLIFYVNDSHQFFPYASVDYGYVSMSGGEISTYADNRFVFSEFYDYSYLKEKALKVLNGHTLTAEEKQEYFITD